MSNKRLRTYSIVTIACAAGSAVYEYFSHGVYSNFMVYVCVIPLVLGVLPEFLGNVFPKQRTSSVWARLLQNFAIATLTVGSALQGVVEIYGTTNQYIVYFFVAGAGLLVASILLWLFEHGKQLHA